MYYYIQYYTVIHSIHRLLTVLIHTIMLKLKSSQIECTQCSAVRNELDQIVSSVNAIAVSNTYVII